MSLTTCIQSLPHIKEITAFEKQFQTIIIGDSEEKVFTILGNPDANNKEFHLGQHEGFEENYKRAEDSGADYFLCWYRGIDCVFVIGINNNTVTIKESGCT